MKRIYKLEICKKSGLKNRTKEKTGEEDNENSLKYKDASDNSADKDMHEKIICE